MDECEKLNEDLSRNQIDSINIHIDNESDDSSAPSIDQFQNNFDNCSSSNSHSPAADELFISKDEEPVYVSIFQKKFLIIKDIIAVFISSFSLGIKQKNGYCFLKSNIDLRNHIGRTNCIVFFC